MTEMLETGKPHTMMNHRRYLIIPCESMMNYMGLQPSKLVMLIDDAYISMISPMWLVFFQLFILGDKIRKN